MLQRGDMVICYCDDYHLRVTGLATFVAFVLFGCIPLISYVICMAAMHVCVISIWNIRIRFFMLLVLYMLQLWFDYASMLLTLID